MKKTRRTLPARAARRQPEPLAPIEITIRMAPPALLALLVVLMGLLRLASR